MTTEMMELKTRAETCKIKPLNINDLYDSVSKSKYSSFKWLLDNGCKPEQYFIGKIVCTNSFWKQGGGYLLDGGYTLSDEEVEKSIEFMIESGLTTGDKVSLIQSVCHSVTSITWQAESIDQVLLKSGGYNPNLQFLIDFGISPSISITDTTIKLASLESIKLLIENNASFSNGAEIGLALVNHPNHELVQFIVNKMTSKEIKIITENADPEYIVDAMSRKMHNCESNKILADYAGISDQIDWSQC